MSLQVSLTLVYICDGLNFPLRLKIRLLLHYMIRMYFKLFYYCGIHNKIHMY